MLKECFLEEDNLIFQLLNDIENGDIESSRDRIISINLLSSKFMTELNSLQNQEEENITENELRNTISSSFERTKSSIHYLEEKIQKLRKGMKEMFMERINVDNTEK